MARTKITQIFTEHSDMLKDLLPEDLNPSEASNEELVEAISKIERP